MFPSCPFLCSPVSVPAGSRSSLFGNFRRSRTPVRKGTRTFLGICITPLSSFCASATSHRLGGCRRRPLQHWRFLRRARTERLRTLWEGHVWFVCRVFVLSVVAKKKAGMRFPGDRGGCCRYAHWSTDAHSVKRAVLGLWLCRLAFKRFGLSRDQRVSCRGVQRLR